MTAVKANFTDQTGFFNPMNNGHTVTIIGCGGIGASILPTLVTMGFHRYVLWDPDTVEDRNMASTAIFKPQDLFRPKVDVVKEYLEEYGATDVDVEYRLFTPDDADQLTGIVIAGVDSMAARRVIFDAVSLHPDVSLYADGRIGGEYWQLLLVNPSDVDQLDWYEKHYLFDDSKAAALPCTMRAVVYPAVALGASLAALLARFSRGETVPRLVQQDMRTLENLIMQ